MKFKLRMPTINLSSCNGANPTSSNCSIEIDVREEYANAFRTESYIDFWTRVMDLNDSGSTINKKTSSTTAARLPSYRLFAEHLLDPDQPTVTQILTLAKYQTENYLLLSDYFSQTANAFLFCGSLLKDIDHLRAKYRSLKTALMSMKTNQETLVSHCPVIAARLADFSESSNPFVTPTSGVQAVRVACFDLLKRLELSRGKVQAKLTWINKLRCGSAISLVVLTVSLTVIIVTHAVAILVATPGVIFASMRLGSGRKLAKLSAQLDVAAKGIYILNRDLDTISRLVARLDDELEDMQVKTKFWLEKGRDRVHAVTEFTRQLKKNDLSFRKQLDELEEHLYLCFMTINRARNLVVKEIAGSSLVP